MDASESLHAKTKSFRRNSCFFWKRFLFQISLNHLPNSPTEFKTATTCHRRHPAVTHLTQQQQLLRHKPLITAPPPLVASGGTIQKGDKTQGVELTPWAARSFDAALCDHVRWRAIMIPLPTHVATPHTRARGDFDDSAASVCPRWRQRRWRHINGCCWSLLEHDG